MSRRFQFSLRLVLVAMALIGAGLSFGIRWWTLRHQAAVARERFEEAMARFEFGTARFSEVHAASTAALQAELGVPLRWESSVWLAHLERTKKLEAKAWGIHAMGEEPTRESFDEWERNYNESRAERESIEQRLRLPPDPTLTEYHQLLSRRAGHDEAPNDDRPPSDEIAPPAPEDAAPPAPDSLE